MGAISLYFTKFEIFLAVDPSCHQLVCGKNRLRLRFTIHKTAKLFNQELPNDNLWFWIPSCRFRIPSAGLLILCHWRNLDSGILIVSGILDSLSWITVYLLLPINWFLPRLQTNVRNARIRGEDLCLKFIFGQVNRNLLRSVAYYFWAPWLL